MTDFINKNGERVTLVTNDNLKDFWDYIKTVETARSHDSADYANKNARYDYDIRISEDVKFDDYFADFERKSDEVKSFLVCTMDTSIENADNFSDARRQECYELAKTHPEAFRRMYEYSGNRNWTNKNVFFHTIENKLKENYFTDNLYFINALVDVSDLYFRTGQKSDIRSLPEDKAEIIAKLFADAKSYDRKRQYNGKISARENYSSQVVKEILSRGDLLNYEPKNANVAGIYANEIRAMINESINDKNIVLVDKKFIFDGKHVNKDLLKILFENQLNKNEFVKQDGEQKVHNAEEVQKYIETRDMVLDAAESVVGKYIPNSRGEERINTQKFKALMEEFYGKPFEQLSLGKVGQDYLLSAAYRDINGGNAAKLEKEELGLVIENDKDGYWLKKINEKSPETAKKIISEMNGRFTVRQSRIADIIAPEITLKFGDRNQRNGDIFDTKLGKYKYDEYQKGVANSTKMSIAEKEEFLDKAAEYVSGNLLKKAKQDKAKADELKKDWDEYNNLAYQAQAQTVMADKLSHLQNSYFAIAEKFVGGKPNESEAYLTKENVEKILADFPNCKSLNFPEEGKLPLLFGRKKEDERRKELYERIANFNDEMMSFQQMVKYPNNAWEKYIDLEPYKGRLLETTTITALRTRKDDYDAEVQKNNIRLNNNDVERVEKEYASIVEKSQKIETEKQRVMERKQKLTEAAAGVLAPEKSSLQAVTSDMDKDTKATVRKANKQITDTLAKPVSERIKTVRE